MDWREEQADREYKELIKWFFDKLRSAMKEGMAQGLKLKQIRENNKELFEVFDDMQKNYDKPKVEPKLRLVK